MDQREAMGDERLAFDDVGDPIVRASMTPSPPSGDSGSGIRAAKALLKTAAIATNRRNSDTSLGGNYRHAKFHNAGPLGVQLSLSMLPWSHPRPTGHGAS